MSDTLPEPWLRGPVPGVPAWLQPAAHAFIMSIEDAEKAVAGLTLEQVWHQPGGAAPVGFHLLHLAGSTDRLLTYARGERLGPEQKQALAAEQSPGEPRPGAAELLARWRAGVDAAIDQLRATPDGMLLDARTVGRAALPSTVLGLLFHAAEHASRHTGQLVTTAKIAARSAER